MSWCANMSANPLCVRVCALSKGKCARIQKLFIVFAITNKQTPTMTNIKGTRSKGRDEERQLDKKKSLKIELLHDSLFLFYIFLKMLRTQGSKKVQGSRASVYISFQKVFPIEWVNKRKKNEKEWERKGWNIQIFCACFCKCKFWIRLFLYRKRIANDWS